MWVKHKLEINDYHELDRLLEEMLLNIGNTDPYIRDRLVYNAFAELINNNHLTDAQTMYCVPVTNLITRYTDNPIFFIKMDEIINISTNKISYSHLDTRIIANVRTLLRALYFRVDNEEYKYELLKRLKNLAL